MVKLRLYSKLKCWIDFMVLFEGRCQTIDNWGADMQSSAVCEHSALYALLRCYAYRQRVLHKALIDLRPDLLMLWNLDISTEATRQYQQYRHTHQHSDSSGYWGENDEWLYVNQGFGLQLIHSQTGETLRWNFSDWRRVTPEHFVEYLLWQIETHVVHAALQTFRDSLKRYPHVNRISLHMYVVFLLDRLVDVGAIKRSPCGTRYELI